MEYGVSYNTGCHYVPGDNKILIGFPGHSGFNDDEIIKSITDSIIHETIHKILDRDLNITISCLFDIISDEFRENFNIFQEGLKIKNCRSWKQAIEEDGIEYFLDRYSFFIDEKVLDEYNIRRQ